MKFLLYVSKSPKKISERISDEILSNFHENENFNTRFESEEHYCIFQQLKNNRSHDQSINLENRIILSESYIYNREKLMETFNLDLGCSNTDILRHLHKEGSESFKEVDGAFAFISFDKVTKKIFIARDIFGHIPLYYFSNDSEMIVSNCLQSINTIRPPKEICSKRVIDYILNISSNTKHTFFDGVFRVLPSHSMRLKFNHVEQEKYFDWKDAKKIPIKDLTSSKVFLAFQNAVTSGLDKNDNKVGSTLSGGIDSSAVSSVLSKYLKNDNFLTFSATFHGLDEADFIKTDEKKYINDLINFHNITNKEIKLQYKLDGPYREGNEYRKNLEPYGIINGYIHNRIYDACSNEKVEILFDGLFGDEVVSHGMFTLTSYVAEGKYFKFLSEVNDLKKTGVISKRRRLIKNHLLIPLFRKFKNIFLKNKVEALSYKVNDWSYLLLNKYQNHVQKKSHIPFKSDLEQQIDFLESGMISYSLEQLHNLSSKYNIELRFPFLNKEFIELCLQIPPDQKLKKGITRAYFKESLESILPSSISSRNSKANLGPFSKNQSYEFFKVFRFTKNMPISEYVDIQKVNSQINEVILSKKSNQGFYVFVFNLYTLNEWLSNMKFKKYTH